jgi:tetratricopeptide (TPR) repeat protein
MFAKILIIIIILCLLAIFIILIRKLPKVLVVDTKSNILKQAVVKRRLLEERFERHFKEGGKKIFNILKPLLQKLTKLIKRLYQEIVRLEEIYRHKALKMNFKDEVLKEQKIAKLLNQAEIKLKEEVFDEAEKLYIEVLTLNERNTQAYKGLGKLYLIKKDYEQAKETFEFLLRLTQDDPFIYKSLGEIAATKGDLKMAEEDYLKSLEIDKEDIETYLKLAETYLNLDNPQKAFAIAEQAATIKPNDPRILDFLIEISIIVQDKATALKVYHQLKEVNPENQKLSELKERIDKL